MQSFLAKAQGRAVLAKNALQRGMLVEIKKHLLERQVRGASSVSVCRRETLAEKGIRSAHVSPPAVKDSELANDSPALALIQLARPQVELSEHTDAFIDFSRPRVEVRHIEGCRKSSLRPARRKRGMDPLEKIQRRTALVYGFEVAGGG